MSRKKVNKTTASGRRVLYIGILLLLIAVAFNGYTVAKYASKDNQYTPMVAKNFYLESDLLSASSTEIPNYVLQAGHNEITFSLMNYPDELRCSETNIVCSVQLSGNGQLYEREVTLPATGKIEEQVTFDNLTDGTYEAVVTSVSPYAKTLKAKFTVVSAADDLSYEINDAAGSPNLNVKVTTADYAGNITITWPEKVLPDNTDSLLTDAYGNECTVRVEKYSEYSFNFFKTNPDEYYGDSLQVSKSTS